MPQHILTDGIWMVDLVSEDQERHFLELFQTEEFVEGVFGFLQPFVVFGVDEIDYPGDFGEVLCVVSA